MAPDLNSVPASPRPTPTRNPSNTQPASGSLSRQTSTSVSRRTSQIYPMSPPPLPLASPGGTIASPAQSGSLHAHAFPPLSPGASGYVQTSVDSTGVPMRHPRPMTAAEMHLELEKEQEAVVNRLTRELSALRAHSASVASTTSMSSAADSSIAHAEAATGPMHPTSSRRHRSSSSVSRSGMPVPHRYSISSQPATGDANHRSSSVLSTPRYEEVAQHKAELEEVKKENEALKQRIRQLERMIRGNNESEGQRGRRGAPPSQSSVVGNASTNVDVPTDASAVSQEGSG
ncbi:hypothetical protein P3342_012782 [Pyrenophora teres f. teres]|uniref:Uncharacterized protein n=2 Tax=Pyrenophora teres f. teres TaxID=97479 RepID=E3S0N1_PYRTT|nr:hypothetical protein PTT_15635 [Pyrenophora teres f. teres 0-1]KAE8832464.1 hypothetical protein PTNB85_06856 [Pyrenophora teres f. teres]KAE8836928.1 hypothetical protein HRS9122_07083 [Pyrenophora teres f. teres]KAE8856126.1 hypothetical protein PTNB29_08965 [Pyrenophora teres f. teres]KAK1911481.1 hypothetical protein P3342_012782 [Pyrenophora teres f. teres]